MKEIIIRLTLNVTLSSSLPVILSSSKDESHRSQWAFDHVPLRQAQSDIQSVILSLSKDELVASLSS